MFHIDFASRTPIYEQLYNNILQLISLNVLKPDQKLPPVRTLAVDLGVNPNTISKVYKMLEADGYIYSNVGRGSFVSPQTDEMSAQRKLALEDFQKEAEKALKAGIAKEELQHIIDTIWGGI